MSRAPWLSFCGPRYMTDERSAESAPVAQPRCSTAASSAAAPGCSAIARPNTIARAGASERRRAAAAIAAAGIPVACSTRSGVQAASEAWSSPRPAAAAAGSPSGTRCSSAARVRPWSSAASPPGLSASHWPPNLARASLTRRGWTTVRWSPAWCCPRTRTAWAKGDSPCRSSPSTSTSRARPSSSNDSPGRPPPVARSSASPATGAVKRVRASMWGVPSTPRASFWNRYCSSRLSFSPPRNAIAPGPWAAAISRSRAAAKPTASSKAAGSSRSPSRSSGRDRRSASCTNS